MAVPLSPVTSHKYCGCCMQNTTKKYFKSYDCDKKNSLSMIRYHVAKIHISYKVGTYYGFFVKVQNKYVKINTIFMSLLFVLS